MMCIYENVNEINPVMDGINVEMEEISDNKVQ